MTQKAKIYLSYGMEFADQEAARARSIKLRNALFSLGYDVFNPYTDENNILAKYDIKQQDELSHMKIYDREKFLACMKELRHQDIDELLSSDLVLAYLDESCSGGTAGELTVAAHSNVPIYCIVVTTDLKQISGWVLSCADQIFYTIDDALAYIKNNPII